MKSPFKNKILVPTLFAHSNQLHKYLPMQQPPTAQQKVRQKTKRLLSNDVLTMLQKRDDKNKQTLITSLKDPLKLSSNTPLKLFGKSNGSSKTTLKLRTGSIGSIGLQNYRIDYLMDQSPEAAFEYLLEVEEVEKSKLSDIKQKISKRGIVARSIEEKKKNDLENQFKKYHKTIDKNFNITKIDIMRAEEEKAEKAKDLRDFIERSRLMKEKDLKSRHKRESKGFLITKAPQELKRPKSILQMQPLISSIDDFHKMAGQSLKNFENSFKELEDIRLNFKMKPTVQEEKGVIDYLNEYREKQIKENREIFPITI